MGETFDVETLEDMCSLMCDNVIPQHRKKPVTQTERILQYMLDGNHITGLIALNEFGCMRLPARIADIKKMDGMRFAIRSDYVTVSSGKKVKEYWVDLDAAD